MDSTCELGIVSSLEDTNNLGLSVLIQEDVLDTLPLTCHGGDHCCSRDWPCDLGEGDCNNDHDCSGIHQENHQKRVSEIDFRKRHSV